MMIAATRDGSTSDLNSVSSACSDSLGGTPRYSAGNGRWKISPGIGPKPVLYGATLPVNPIVYIVRPWKAPENAITAERLV